VDSEGEEEEAASGRYKIQEYSLRFLLSQQSLDPTIDSAKHNLAYFFTSSLRLR